MKDFQPKKNQQKKQAKKKKEELSFRDFENMMRSRSYGRGPGGAIRQRKF